MNDFINFINFKYMPDPTGIYTDSAQFTSIVSECTNISVGYYNEHTTSERQDILHLERLCEVVCKLDWENLPIFGVVTKNYGYEDHDYDFYNYDSTSEWSYDNYSYFKTQNGSASKMFISKTQIDTEKEAISNWLRSNGYSNFETIEWNGNSLYVKIESENFEYFGDRIELCDLIPDLCEVEEVYVKKRL